MMVKKGCYFIILISLTSYAYSRTTENLEVYGDITISSDTAKINLSEMGLYQSDVPLLDMESGIVYIGNDSVTISAEDSISTTTPEGFDIIIKGGDPYYTTSTQGTVYLEVPVSINGVTNTPVAGVDIDGNVTAESFTGDGSYLDNTGIYRYNALTFRAVADGAVTAGDIVYPSVIIGEYIYAGQADNTSSLTLPVMGIAAESAASGSLFLVRYAGFLEGIDTSSFSALDKVYLSTGGNMTSTPPSTGAVIPVGVVCEVGTTTGSMLVMTSNAELTPAPTPTPGLDEEEYIYWYDANNYISLDRGSPSGVKVLVSGTPVARVDSRGFLKLAGEVEAVATPIAVSQTTIFEGDGANVIRWAQNGEVVADFLSSGTLRVYCIEEEGGAIETEVQSIVPSDGTILFEAWAETFGPNLKITEVWEDAL